MTEIPSGSLRHAIAYRIRQLILEGELAPGSKVDQDGLGRRFGVSRVPLREALVQLEAESLIVNVPRRGAYVRRLSPADIENQYTVLGRVAGVAARRAAIEPNVRLVQTVGRLLERLQQFGGKRESAKLWAELYRSVTRAGASGWLLSTLERLEESIPLSLYHSVRHDHQEWHDEAMRSALKLHSALSEADGNAAEAAMHDYLGASTASTKAALVEKGYFGPSEGAASAAPEIEQDRWIPSR
jgi:DNA-binding GntR family transcriptional regulator